MTFILKGLKSTVKLIGLSGMTHGPKKQQSPYLRIGVGGTGLLIPGTPLHATLRFSAKPNKYTPIVMAGPVTP